MQQPSSQTGGPNDARNAKLNKDFRLVSYGVAFIVMPATLLRFVTSVLVPDGSSLWLPVYGLLCIAAGLSVIAVIHLVTDPTWEAGALGGPRSRSPGG